jgi:hypothetical protein
MRYRLLALFVATFGLGLAHGQESKGWVSLFNGKNLDGWSPKIKGYDFGVNFGNTFRVVDGVIRVSYDQYGGKFDGRFGHLFYKNPYSNYIMRLEYRFVGEQLPDGPGWAFKNSGVMIHGQDPKTMAKDQDFPVSCEVQLLGGDKEGERSTANVCSPGTNIVMGGKLITQHCNNSTSPTFRHEEWVKLEIEVHGAATVIHRVNGKEVLTYSEIQFDPNDADAKRLIKGPDLHISGGSISLQSESAPVEFRNIEIRNL